jgi:hypothetical protein
LAPSCSQMCLSLGVGSPGTQQLCFIGSADGARQSLCSWTWRMLSAFT